MKSCNTLEELRTEIDAIDDKIVAMIGERNEYIKQASKFKKSVDEIKSSERIDTVVDRVRHKAVMMGMSPNMMAEVYTILINEMVETEIAEFRNSGTF
ncbi:MAG: chorismate mutase [Campylobacterota bacterium]|nr:chorismate mutase [Campylobacterota bacterium]